MNSAIKIGYKEIIKSISKELELFEEEYRQQFRTESFVIQPLLDYLIVTKGKWFRPILFFLSQGLINRPKPESVRIAVLLELLHAATLIHDDVVDSSPKRRGRKTLNEKWGDKVSVLTGDFLLAKVLKLGVDSRWPEVLGVISRVVTKMADCELRQVIQTHEEDQTPESYFRVIQDKTAGFFAAASELGGIVAEADSHEKERLVFIGDCFGMAFQIRDDILDLSGSCGQMGKPVRQDIYNGKITLPLIFALEKASIAERDAVFNNLYRGEEEKRVWILEFVKEKGGIRRAQEKAEHYIKEATQILESFKPSVYRNALEKLFVYDLVRNG
jgi:octaprenyl-diphosphate synthase